MSRTHRVWLALACLWVSGCSPSAPTAKEDCEGACANRLDVAQKGCPVRYNLPACVEACVAAERSLPGSTGSPCVRSAQDCAQVQACSQRITP